MKKILTGRQMLLCDKYTIEEMGIPSRDLMERAAVSLCRVLDGAEFDLSRVIILCGVGNNGGDGMAMAHIMKERGVDVSVILVGDLSKCTPESAYRLSVLESDGIEVSDSLDFSFASLIVDALFGAGLQRLVEGIYLDAIRAVNASSGKVFSVDIPSGISSDSGEIMGDAIRADMTAAISNLKRGHVFYPGAEYCGRVEVCDIGIPDEIINDTDALFCLEDGDLAPVHPRQPYSNKGTFGRVLVIGGSFGMAGAPYFSALAAYRSGAGLCEVFAPEENRQILQTLLPEAVMTVCSREDWREKLTVSLGRADSVVIGPGLGTGELAIELVKQTFAECKVPMVCDADALNIVASEGLSFPSCPMVITPHLGEMSRLCGESVTAIQASLVPLAVDYAKRKSVVCLLKDARSVISDGERAYVNVSGCSAMAKGGSGDVLTGIIAALLAAGFSPVDSAAYGSFVHGRAGERCAEKYGAHAVLARDIADAIKR